MRGFLKRRTPKEDSSQTNPRYHLEEDDFDESDLPPPPPRESFADEEPYYEFSLEDDVSGRNEAKEELFRKVDDSLGNRKKFVDFRKQGRTGGEVNSKRLSDVVVTSSSGKPVVQRASKIVQAFSEEVNHEQVEEEKDVLSSFQFKKKKKPKQQPQKYVFRKNGRNKDAHNVDQSTLGTNILTVAKKIVAGPEAEMEQRFSLATQQTYDSVRSSEVMPAAAVDFGLSSERLRNLDKEDMNIISNDDQNRSNEIFGVGILDKDIASHFNKQKKMEARKDLKRMEKQERRRNMINRMNPFKNSKSKGSKDTKTKSELSGPLPFNL